MTAKFEDWPLEHFVWSAVQDALPEGTSFMQSHDISVKIVKAIEEGSVEEIRYRSLKRAYRLLGKKYGEQSQRLGKAYGEAAMLREQLRDFNEHDRRSTFRRMMELAAEKRALEAVVDQLSARVLELQGEHDREFG